MQHHPPEVCLVHHVHQLPDQEQCVFSGTFQHTYCMAFWCQLLCRHCMHTVSLCISAMQMNMLCGRVLHSQNHFCRTVGTVPAWSVEGIGGPSQRDRGFGRTIGCRRNQRHQGSFRLDQQDCSKGHDTLGEGALAWLYMACNGRFGRQEADCIDQPRFCYQHLVLVHVVYIHMF